MKNFIFLTLVTDFLAGFVYLISVSLLGNHFVNPFLTFGNVLIPTLMAVILFKFVKHRIRIENIFLRLSIQGLLALLIYADIHLVIFALDVLLNTSYRSVDHIKMEYFHFMPVLVFYSIFLPWIEYRLDLEEKAVQTS